MKPLDLLNPAFLYRKRDRIVPYARARAHDLRLSLAAPGLPFTEKRRRLDEKFERLAALKDAHKGRRCFIVCTGRSLRLEDLNRLKDEITISSNKIFLAFDRTDWRPNYFTVVDEMVALNNRREIDALALPKIVDLKLRSIFDDGDDYLYFRMSPAGYETHPFGFSEDAARCVYGGYTVTYCNLQLAWHLGCREIYLIGLDFSFRVPEEKQRDRQFGYRLKADGEDNHFVPNYRRPGEVWTMPRLDLQRMAYRKAREHAEAAGGRIVNASRFTELDVFPRADFDQLLG